MKNSLSCLFFVIMLSGCKNAPGENEMLFDRTFNDYTEIEALAAYKKESDTSIDLGEIENSYRLMNLRRNDKNLVLFYKIADRDPVVVNKYAYQALDTLQIDQLGRDERLTIGYCTTEELQGEEVIAVVKENDSIYIANVVRAWRANPETEEIELLQNLEEVQCINEFFQQENASIPVEKIG